MRLVLEQMGAPQRGLSASHLCEVAALLNGSDGAVSLPGGLEARVQGSLLTLGLPLQRPDTTYRALSLDCPGVADLEDGRRIECRIEAMDWQAFEMHCRQNARGVEFVDAETVQGHLICRPRREGDSFRPLGSPGSQSVSNFLTNQKILQHLRAQVVCVCDDLGIVYLAPLRIDERVRVQKGTSRALRLEASGFGQRTSQ